MLGLAKRETTKSRLSWKRRATISVGALATVAVSQLATAGATFATTPTSGPAAANIVQTFQANTIGTVALRSGTTKFGEQHIRVGGSGKNTQNHELTDFAKQQWQAAMKSDPIVGRYDESRVFSHQYTYSGGKKRTMCVITDVSNFVFSNVSYGDKGIITAFWIDGWVNAPICNSSPD